MNEHLKNILEEYDDEKSNYSDFNLRCKSLIVDLLKLDGVNYHQITDRIKDRGKLESKILKKGLKYSKLAEITDIAGIRIISYFEDEVDKIADIISSTFDVDLENSIDKRNLEADRFGYRSLHYVVTLKTDRAKLPEYSRFSGLKIEIQIRTILQHSWAEIEHDLGYKNEVAIPDFARRTFYRVAALLETADLEFVKLKDLLKQYEDKITVEISKNPETVALDQTSLSLYINSSTKVAELDQKFADWMKLPIDNDDQFSANSLLPRLLKAGFSTIKQVDDFINKNSEELLESYKQDIGEEKEFYSSLSKGMVIYQIDLYLQKKENSR